MACQCQLFTKVSQDGLSLQLMAKSENFSRGYLAPTGDAPPASAGAMFEPYF